VAGGAGGIDGHAPAQRHGPAAQPPTRPQVEAKKAAAATGGIQLGGIGIGGGDAPAWGLGGGGVPGWGLGGGDAPPPAPAAPSPGPASLPKQPPSNNNPFPWLPGSGPAPANGPAPAGPPTPPREEAEPAKSCAQQ
jgi:hypothetical protein